MEGLKSVIQDRIIFISLMILCPLVLLQALELNVFKSVVHFHIDTFYKPCGWEREYLFCVNNGLRQGCGMYPWLFNIRLNGVAREVY